ncbi:MAG: aspartate aminotransferase family protein [Deltaproteobacteria bacterium]|nr:MAG: aspartate aminotransferase family protein [Deltaproteobacteria bacterium]
MKPKKNGRETRHIFYRDLNREYPVIERGEGIYLYTREGKRIIDGASGAAVVSLGHANPRLVEALKKQAEKVAFVHLSTFSSEPLLKLADEIASVCPPPLKRVYFTSGGSEAVEGAIKLARQYHVERGNRDKHKVISRFISYHGSTIGALSISGHAGRRSKYAPLLSSFPRIPPPYCYRCAFREHRKTPHPPHCDFECAYELERAILSEGPELVSAFIFEPIIGASAPAVAPPVGYLRRIRRICNKYDVLLIADEVMTGFGRTGKFFAFQHYDAIPDIVTVSKSMSSGYSPLGAIIISDEIYRVIEDSPTGAFVHGHTFAGNPLSAAVGLEVIRILKEEKYVERVAQLGEYLAGKLEGLKRRHPTIGDVRCRGLLAGVEFVSNRKTKKPFPREMEAARKIADLCLEKGLYLYPGKGSCDGVRGDHLLMAPPYIITEEQIDEMIEVLSEAIAEFEETVLSEETHTTGQAV